MSAPYIQYPQRGYARPTRPQNYKVQLKNFGRQQSFAPTSRASLMMPETKYFDVGINGSTTWAGTTFADTEVPCDNYVNSSGTAAAYSDSALIPSAVGSGYGQVNGNRYKLKKIRVRGDVAVNILPVQDDANYARLVRVMLVMDTQPNGTQAQGEDIIQDVGASSENLYAYKRVASSSGRFRILKDQFITLQPTTAQTDGTATSSNGFQSQQFSMQYQPKTPIQVNIKSGNSTPTVAGLETCNIFLLMAGIDAGNGSAVQTFMHASARTYYSD